MYHGFYVMATGTGKTWTAIFSGLKLSEDRPVMWVICAPYKHLVRQWADDVIKAVPKATIIMVSSENHTWEQQMSQAIVRQRLEKDTCKMNFATNNGGYGGSTLSEGSLTIIVGIAAAVVFGLGGFFIGTKRKKHALAGGKEDE